MTLSQNLVKGTNDLYVPNYDLNIYKILPTALRSMGINIAREDLYDNAIVRNHLVSHNALEANQVIVCIVDSLGLNNIQGTSLGKLFDQLRGVTLSSTFPTITSSAITSIHHGLPPTKHGILGHRIYFREYDTIVDTLRMTGQGAYARDAIFRAGVNVRALLWSSPIVDILQQRVGSSLVYAEGLPSYIAGTGLGHFFTASTTIVPYVGFVDAFGMMRRVMRHSKGKPLFITLYFADIDFLAHKYGPYSREYREGCNTFLRHLRAFTESLPSQTAKNTTIFICSDHGQNSFRNERKLHISLEELDEIQKTLLHPPGYSGRVMHFYCKSESKRKQLKRWLQNHVEDRALVLEKKEFARSQLLPGRITTSIVERLGDLLLLSRDGVDVEVERNRMGTNQWGLLPEQKWLASHGSLSADELFTPFLAFNAQVLR